MAKKITISFKETDRDMKLLALILSKSDKSAWIKDILLAVIEKEEKEN